MANNLIRSPLIIDTPGGGVLIPRAIRFRKVRWKAKTAVAGDEVVVTDATGRTVWESVAPGPNYVEDTVINESCPGLIVPTLASGKLYIHYREGGNDSA